MSRNVILIVDDEPNTRKGLQWGLEGAGREILTAGDGREALAMLRSRDVDLLITDLKMPDGSTTWKPQ